MVLRKTTNLEWTKSIDGHDEINIFFSKLCNNEKIKYFIFSIKEKNDNSFYLEGYSEINSNNVNIIEFEKLFDFDNNSVKICLNLNKKIVKNKIYLKNQNNKNIREHDKEINDIFIFRKHILNKRSFLYSKESAQFWSPIISNNRIYLSPEVKIYDNKEHYENFIYVEKKLDILTKIIKNSNNEFNEIFIYDFIINFFETNFYENLDKKNLFLSDIIEFIYYTRIYNLIEYISYLLNFGFSISWKSIKDKEFIKKYKKNIYKNIIVEDIIIKEINNFFREKSEKYFNFRINEENKMILLEKIKENFFESNEISESIEYSLNCIKKHFKDNLYDFKEKVKYIVEKINSENQLYNLEIVKRIVDNKNLTLSNKFNEVIKANKRKKLKWMANSILDINQFIELNLVIQENKFLELPSQYSLFSEIFKFFI